MRLLHTRWSSRTRTKLNTRQAARCKELLYSWVACVYMDTKQWRDKLQFTWTRNDPDVVARKKALHPVEFTFWGVLISVLGTYTRRIRVFTRLTRRNYKTDDEHTTERVKNGCEQKSECSLVYSSKVFVIQYIMAPDKGLRVGEAPKNPWIFAMGTKKWP